MPKRTKRRGPKGSNNSVQNNQYSAQKPRPTKRDQIIKIGAIVIVLALTFTLLLGALISSPAKAETVNSGQIVAAAALDTDNDGIENNMDPDIDGDGIVNGEDPDIDGDGKPNFGDGDPAETNGIDTENPNHPEGVTLKNLAEDNPGWVVGLVVALVAILSAGAVFWRLKTRKKLS